MIRYLFDTNICIDVIRQRAPGVVTRLRRRKIGSIGISTITLAELQFGVAKSIDPPRNTIALAHFCAPLEICPFDHEAASIYGEVRVDLERAGTPIGPLDPLIAAHARALNAVLITSNEREFSRVAGLHVENWSRP